MSDLGLIVDSGHWFSWAQWSNSALAALIFTAFGRWLRGVSNSGAVAGAVVCFLLSACAGGGALIALVSVFVLTWIATRFGYSRKQRLGTAEKSGRTASQVLANLGVGTIAAVLFAVYGKAGFLLAMAAALSEASADTVSPRKIRRFDSPAMKGSALPRWIRNPFAECSVESHVSQIRRDMGAQHLRPDTQDPTPA